MALVSFKGRILESSFPHTKFWSKHNSLFLHGLHQRFATAQNRRAKWILTEARVTPVSQYSWVSQTSNWAPHLGVGVLLGDLLCHFPKQGLANFARRKCSWASIISPREQIWGARKSKYPPRERQLPWCEALNLFHESWKGKLFLNSFFFCAVLFDTSWDDKDKGNTSF